MFDRNPLTILNITELNWDKQMGQESSKFDEILWVRRP